MKKNNDSKILTYDGRKYKVFSTGTIIRLSFTSKNNCFFKEKLLTPKKHSGGYLQVYIGTKGSRGKNEYIHRIVAKCFLKNKKNLPQVNHKNGIKIDNRLINLEWCSSLDNIKHANETGLTLVKPKYSVLCFDKLGSFYKRFESTNDASKYFKVSPEAIRSVLLNKSRTCSGYWFCKEDMYNPGKHNKGYISDRFKIYNSRTVVRTDVNGISKTYLSIGEAIRDLDLNPNGSNVTKITECSKSIRKTFKGYKWEIISVNKRKYKTEKYNYKKQHFI